MNKQNDIQLSIVNDKKTKPLKKYALVGVGIGILLAIINTFYVGLIGLGFAILFPFLSFALSLLFSCSGEGCWGAIIILGDIIIITATPLTLLFIKYVFDVKNYPFTNKKVTFVSLVILFTLISHGIYFLEGRAQTYSYKANYANSQNKSYESLSECKGKQPYEITGDCYGYFASLKDDINLCDEYLKDFSELNKNYTTAECITSFAINKKDIFYCDRIRGGDKDIYIQKCMSKYYVKIGNSNGCSKITDDYLKKYCIENTLHTQENNFIRWYAKFRSGEWSK